MSSDPREILDDLDAWRTAYRRARSAPPGPCLDDEAIVGLVVGDMDPEERLELADHVALCPSCASRWRIARDLHREVSATRARPSRRPWAALGVVAAAVLVVVGLALFLESPGAPPPTSGPRGPAALDQQIEPPHGERLAAPPSVLSWSSALAEAPYRVVVYDAESVPLWESDPTPETRVRLPPELRERLAGGGAFYWRIRSESGPVSRSSALARFEIAPP